MRGFVVFAAASAGRRGEGPRLGVTVSRRVGGSVVRSHVKRRIREWFRRERAKLESDLDLVVIGRPTAARLSGAEVAALLCRGAREAGAVRA